jgi:hypothetical protein
MVNYFISGVWATLSVLVVATHYQVDSLAVGAMMAIIAGLIITARWQEDRYQDAVKQCKAAHPSAWPTVTEPYDWSKDQDGTTD